MDSAAGLRWRSRFMSGPKNPPGGAPTQRQARFLALARQARERAARSQERDIAAGYEKLAEGYEALAQGFARLAATRGK